MVELILTEPVGVAAAGREAETLRLMGNLLRIPNMEGAWLDDNTIQLNLGEVIVKLNKTGALSVEANGDFAPGEATIAGSIYADLSMFLTPSNRGSMPTTAIKLKALAKHTPPDGGGFLFHYLFRKNGINSFLVSLKMDYVIIWRNSSFFMFDAPSTMGCGELLATAKAATCDASGKTSDFLIKRAPEVVAAVKQFGSFYDVASFFPKVELERLCKSEELPWSIRIRVALALGLPHDTFAACPGWGVLYSQLSKPTAKVDKDAMGDVIYTLFAAPNEREPKPLPIEDAFMEIPEVVCAIMLSCGIETYIIKKKVKAEILMRAFDIISESATMLNGFMSRNALNIVAEFVSSIKGAKLHIVRTLITRRVVYQKIFNEIPISKKEWEELLQDPFVVKALKTYTDVTEGFPAIETDRSMLLVFKAYGIESTARNVKGAPACIANMLLRGAHPSHRLATTKGRL